MPLTIEYWTKVWDEAQSDIKDSYGGIYEGENAYPGKALNLLSQYAAYSKLLMTFGWHKNRVGASLHFFSKRWSDQYTTQVVDAINNFYHVAGSHATSEEYHTVEFILARVKHEMGNTLLDPNDNLAKILEVIHIKTTVDYANLNADIILNRYNARNDVNTITEVITSQPVERSGMVSNPRNNITPSLTRYLDGFQNEDSFSDAFERLEIDNEEKRYRCPVSLNITNKPVRTDGILFDYSSLVGLPITSNGTRINPVSKEYFYLDQIQPDRDVKTAIETLIRQYEAMPKHGK